MRATQTHNHAASQPAEAGGEFVRGLGLLDSTMLVAGSMIGSGIFIVSADIARLVGSPGWLLVVWAVTGVLTIVAALSYGELAGMMPKAGGQYVYLREAYNPLAGFTYGWTLFMVIQTGTNLRGVSLGKIIQRIFTSTKLLALFGLIIAGIIVALKGNIFSQNLTDM